MANKLQSARREGPLPRQFTSVEHIQDRFRHIHTVYDPVTAANSCDRICYQMSILEGPGENENDEHEPEVEDDEDMSDIDEGAARIDDYTYNADVSRNVSSNSSSEHNFPSGTSDSSATIDNDEDDEVDSEPETEYEIEKNTVPQISVRPGYIIDPIFGFLRKRSLCDDEHDRPRRLWDEWRFRLREQRVRKGRPLGYVSGDTQYEYKQWMKIKAKRVEKAQRYK
jgi:cobalamin biosynthesis protein CobT